MMYAGLIQGHWNFKMPVIALLLTIPIVLFSVMNYDINPAFFLAPVIAFTLLRKPDKVWLLFFISFFCGAISIFLAEQYLPDGAMVRHFLALVLIMFAPSFIFLGKYVSGRIDIQRAIFWLAAFSAVFVVVIAGRVLILNEPVRIYFGPLGLAAMNAEFLGLPVFATFGVLSLADLICIQAVIICGAIFGSVVKPAGRLALIVAFGGAVFLVLGSDSRSAQVLAAWIAGSVVLFGWRNPAVRKLAMYTLIAALAAGVLTYARGMNENRMATSIKSIGGAHNSVTISGKSNESGKTGKSDESGKSGEWVDSRESVEELRAQADAFATGRVELAIEGVREVVNSPIIGNGFSNYGRYDGASASKILAANTSTHVYYLTLIWKGGIIFFVPFIAMLLMNFRDAWLSRKHIPATPEGFFTWSAVFMTFGPMAMAWDVLIVPSAGALAYFLFGLLVTPKKV
jgi:hypothetical protein